MIKAEQMTARTENLSGDSPESRPVTVGHIWEAARQLGFPVALWRLPEKEYFQLIISNRKELKICKPDLEDLPAGFMISAYDNADGEAVLFMESDIWLRFSAGSQLAGPEDFQGDFPAAIREIYLKSVELMETSSPDRPEAAPLTFLPDEDQESRFKRIVQLGAEAVQSGALFKVVLSRTKSFAVAPGFDMVRAFLRLEAAYPAAFVSMAYLPAADEIWLGASPELLVEVSGDRYFRTTALAGTQGALDEHGNLIPKFRVRWGEKEIEEQALVSRYIIECFKKIRLREYHETGPRSSRAGNVYHLKSDYEVNMNAVGFPELGSVMLRLLHPTSAVCGTPKEKAAQLVEALEGYERSFYSGFWGPVNVGNEIHLFVNLRTLRVRDGVATLFAGAGITADSDPDGEWEETELKCGTLLDVIHQPLQS